jgi:hypothetical protein
MSGGTGGTSSTGAGGTSSTGGSAGSGGAAGSLGAAGAGVGDGGAMTPADETLCGDVQLAMNKTIAASKITEVCAGATVTAAAGVSITIQGTLRVVGTMAMPAKFQGAQHGSMGWAGIVIAGGGSLQMTYGEIHDAVMPITAQPKSDFNVDHLLIDNSRDMLALDSDGTINHGVFHGLANAQTTDPINVGDKAPTASPSILNTTIDKGGGKDYITVSGAQSKAVFDHLDLTGAHCAFHFNSGSGITISNSNIHTNAYGLMVEGSVNTKITHNNFTANKPAIGDCGGGSAMVTDNYIDANALGGTPSCVGKVTPTMPAGAAFPMTGAGAVGPQ